ADGGHTHRGDFACRTNRLPASRILRSRLAIRRPLSAIELLRRQRPARNRVSRRMGDYAVERIDLYQLLRASYGTIVGARRLPTNFDPAHQLSVRWAR